MLRKINFYKFQATLNDFIIIENNQLLPGDIVYLCDRRKGIGADGLFVIQKVSKEDGLTIYFDFFNNDGKRTSFCGNGARCLALYALRNYKAKETTLVYNTQRYKTKVIDFCKKNKNYAIVNLLVCLNKVPQCLADNKFFIDTGSPHVVIFKEKLEDISKWFKEAQSIRYSKEYEPNGVNVTFFLTKKKSVIYIKTYERGVESFTPSCGTGALAAAITYVLNVLKKENGEITIETDGGTIKSSIEKEKSNGYNLSLIGPAFFVFEGVIKI